MSNDPLAEQAKQITAQNKAMIKAAFNAAKGVKAKYIFVYIDAVEDNLLPETLPRGVHLILVSKKKNFSFSGKASVKDIITLPKLKLGRMGLIKVAVILALSAKSVTPEDPI